MPRDVSRPDYQGFTGRQLGHVSVPQDCTPADRYSQNTTLQETRCARPNRAFMMLRWANIYQRSSASCLRIVPELE